MTSDLRFAFRGLKKSPGFALTAVATLALGIGANTAIFSLVNQLLLNPPGIADPARVVAVRVRYEKLNMTSIGMSAPNFANVRDSRDLFEHTAIVGSGQYNYTGGAVPEQLKGSPVSVEFFDVFDAKPQLGRVFVAEEDKPNANRVVVLAHAAWQRLFGGDAAIVGKTIDLNQTPYQIVGVMGPEFRWPQQEDLWTPLGLPDENYTEDFRFNESYFAAARLQPGVTLERANAFINVLADRVRQNGTRGGQYAQDSLWGMFAVPMTDFIARETKTPLLVLSGAVGLVLLIACSNIAGLMLARASGRGREIAVRIAMGARGWQLLRQTLAESLLLAFSGAIAGLGLAYGSIHLLLQLAPESAAAGLQARIDVYVLLFTAVAAILSGILFGIAPAWQVGRLNPYEILKSAGRSATAGRGRQHLRSGLVVGEAALALVLLVGAGLFLRSFSRLQDVSPGFEPRGVMTAMLSLPQTQYGEPERRVGFYRALIERLEALPGATSVGLGVPLPFTGNGSSASFRVEGRQAGPGDPGPHGNVRWVTPGYFAAMGIPLKSGRGFSDADRADTAPVVLIDENLARQYWPDQDAVGKHMRRGGDDTPWSTVVGVVGHITHSDLATEEEKGTYYYSMFQQPPPFAGIVLKTQQEPGSFAGGIRGAVLAVDPAQPVDQLRTMQQMIGNSLAAQRLATRLLGFFAAAALFLAALGLYGVISYSVMQRTQEIGVRMALGAQRGQVLSLVVSQGLKLAGAGVALGVVLAVVLSRALEGQLYGVAALDPLTFVAMATVLLGAAFLASYLPARRATKVDPLQALRYE